MFIVKLAGKGGGCDAPLGCNECTVTLPDSIKTMEEAAEYVAIQEKEGGLSFYGLDNVKTAAIYEVTGFCELDIPALVRARDARRVADSQAAIEHSERVEFARLQAKFGKSQECS